MSTRTSAYDVGRRRRRPTGPGAGLAWALGAAAVAGQVAYPLVDGEWLRRVTIASVLLFALASVTHAAVHHGVRWAATFVVVTAGGAFVAEAVGVRTGIPFGDYSYSDSLGPRLLDVPAVVPLAWTMMAYPMFVAARRLGRHLAPVVGGLGMTGWDVFLDPQLVADGRWRWADPTPSLPGVDGVPLTNYVGWLLVGTALMGLLSLALPTGRASEALPAALLVWTYAGSVLGNLVWFGTDAVALAGGVTMGAVVVPYVWVLWQSRP